MSFPEFFLVIGAKSSLFFLVAMLVTLGMRRRAAAARHLVWAGALVGAALLPVIGSVVPTWDVPVLSSGRQAERSSSPASDVVLRPTPNVATTSEHGLDESTAESISSLGNAGRSMSALASPITRAAALDGAGRRIDGALLLLGVWAVGVLLLLSRMAFSVLSLRRIERRATPVSGAGWHQALVAIGHRDDDIALLVSDDIDVPVTWGMFRHVILLPREADEWSAARRELVLRHELAHVARLDVLTQLLARVVSALHWPNPLAWLAERNLRRECEQACDDAVLAAGVRPTRYAEELLAILSELAPRGVVSLAPGLASGPSIEQRLHALLDARLARRRATRLDAAVTGVGVLAFALPLAAMTPAERGATLQHGHDVAIETAALPLTPKLVSRAASLTEVPPATSLGESAAEQLCAADGRSSHSNLTQEREGMKTWEVHWSGRDCAVDLRAEGDIKYDDDLSDITSISRNGFFDVSLRDGDVLTRLVIRSSARGELDRHYTVNGAEQAWNDRAQAWFADFLLQLDRQTGFAIDQRFPKLLARGVPAVFDEIEKLGSDYVRGRYLERLIERAKLSPAQVRQTLEVAGRDVRSDYELTRVLLAVAERYGLPDEDTRATFLTATNGLSSDYERNRALHALLSRSDLSPREAAATLQSASALTNDYELARTLVLMTDKKLVAPSLRPLYLRDAAKISSDYERARVLLGLLGSGTLTTREVAEVIRLTSEIKNDYERARVLVTVASGYELGDDMRDAYLAAARSISNEYERGRALSALRKS